MPDNRTIERREPISSGRFESGRTIDTGVRTIDRREPISSGRFTSGRGIEPEPARTIDRREPISSGRFFSGRQVDTNIPNEKSYLESIAGLDQFEILADAFNRAFGGSVYNPPRESERTVIESTGGGTNIGLLLLLASVGFGIYYFYFRQG